MPNRTALHMVSTESNHASHCDDNACDQNNNGDNKTFQTLLCRLMRKDEVSSIKKFSTGGNFDIHMKLVIAKMEELNIDGDDRVSFLLDTLDDRVKHELFVLPDFHVNKKSLPWIDKQLREIFQPKTSAVNPLVELLQIKQHPQQKLRDYVSAIRVEAWRVMGEGDDKKREEYCVAAFIDGLYNRRCSVALKQLVPKTLEEAFKLVKHTDNENGHDDTNMRIMEKPTDFGTMEKMLASMNSEIRSLRNQVSLLTSEVAKIPKFTYAQKVQTQPRIQQLPSRMGQTPHVAARIPTIQAVREPIVCYNCNNTGHIARQCTEPPFCRYCKTHGHSSLQCNSKPNDRAPQRIGGNVRNMQGGSDACTLSDCGSIVTRNGFSPLDDEAEEMLVVPNMNFIECNPCDVKRKSVPRTKISKIQQVDPSIRRWTNYIEGNGARPRKHYNGTRTVISRSNREVAANKPIVPCMIKNQQKNVFFDSGSDNNVIDEQYARQLGLRISKQSGRLNCANGTPLRTKGTTCLRFGIGSRSVEFHFTVAERIFPSIFVGLKSMKQERISIHPEDDCIIIAGEKVSFLSKVEAEVRVQGN